MKVIVDISMCSLREKILIGTRHLTRDIKKQGLRQEHASKRIWDIVKDRLRSFKVGKDLVWCVLTLKKVMGFS